MPGKRKNTGLGKGLEALFADTGSGVSIGAENTSHEDEVANISIHRIKPNEEQPRKNFDREKIHELAVSIQQHGVIQPIIVCPEKNGSYEIVAGERRWRAAREAGLEEIPCLVRKLNDEELALFAIVENMQREDLNPVEEAEGLDRMIHSFGMTQQQVSESVGKSRPYITNALRLLKLDTAVKDLLREGKLSTGHAREIGRAHI